MPSTTLAPGQGERTADFPSPSLAGPPRSHPQAVLAVIAAGALAAILLLVGVGISSARAAWRRLRYETWYYLHFYTYLAIALAFSHQFAVGVQFIASRPARTLTGTTSTSAVPRA